MNRACAVVFLLLLNFSVEAEKVDWYVTDFYPCHVLSGPQKEQGYCDKALSKLLKKIDSFEHNVALISGPKLNEKMMTGAPFCTLSLLETEERKKHLIYSDPVMAVLPNGLIILRDDKRFEPYLDNKQRVVLSKLVTNEELVFGRVTARSYGSKIDQILDADYVKYPSIMTGWDLPFVDLLRTGRIDYFISYPAAALGKEVAVYENEQIQFLSIYEDSQLYFPGFSCTKGELGERVIHQINQQMKILGRDYFANDYELWLPGSVKKLYRNLIKENTE
jgi:uncharacterized protein (TIGR02285 family)